MNKVLIVAASDSDRRLMSGLLTHAGYEPITVEKMETDAIDRTHFADSLDAALGAGSNAPQSTA